jgi:F-type H+-transporting ATPase subunit alpha
VTAFVPTNVISITDGQIFLETDLFNAGIRPAMNAGISVSRVGRRRADRHRSKKLGGGIRLDARAVPRTGRLRAVRLRPRRSDPHASSTAARASTELLKQKQYAPLSVDEHGRCRSTPSTTATSTRSPVKQGRRLRSTSLQSLR